MHKEDKSLGVLQAAPRCAARLGRCGHEHRASATSGMRHERPLSPHSKSFRRAPSGMRGKNVLDNTAIDPLSHNQAGLAIVSVQGAKPPSLRLMG